MKIEEIRKTNTKELMKKAQELKEKLSDIRFTLSANQLKNVKEVGNIKKEIARILTILQETSTKKQ